MTGRPRWARDEPLSAEPPVPTAVNPWPALPTGRPGPDPTRRLRAAHERLVTGAGPADDAVRAVVIDSWRRSLGSGVDPDGGAPLVDLLDDDLLAHREARPRAGRRGGDGGAAW